MSTIWAIALKDIKEAFQKRSTYIYVGLMLVISFPSYLGGLREVLRSLDAQNATSFQTVQAVRGFLDGTTYTQPLTLSMLFCTYLSAYALILEKAKRTMESLLATPASLRQVWFGKTLAVAVPAIVLTLLILMAAVVVFNLTVIIPQTGTFVMPSSVPMVTVLVLIPLLILAVVSVVAMLQLTMSNPRLANFAFILVFFGFYMITIARLSSSWNFAFIYVLAFAVLAAVNMLASRFLTKERVVLSSKGLG